MLRECVVLVLMCFFGAGGLSGRGFFCRDPDTGKLHPANSTWTATTFCGKYHCKIKRKNITSSQYAPLREINITNIQLLGENLTTIDVKKKEVFVKKDETVTTETSVDNRTEPDITDRNNSSKEFQGITLDTIIDGKNASDKDRYLSEQEIKTLTELLHTLKKGDLDTIVEIYNLAQDIYKELDKTSTDHVLQEAMTTAETLNKQNFKSDVYKKITKHNHASYWYEPLSSGKTRLTDIMRPDVIRTDINPDVPAVAVALELPASVNGVPVSKPTLSTSKAHMDLIPPIPAFQIRKISDTFFNSPLTYKDFGKLPYYYPMSNFQRMASYKHEQNKKITVNAETLAPTTVGPLSTFSTAPVANTVQKTLTNKSLHIGGKYQKQFGPSIFLPYPFTNIQHNNWSLPQNIYHRNKLETRRNEESLFDKLELLRSEENLYGTGRKGETLAEQSGKRRKQENVDKIELLVKEENLFNLLGSHRKEKNLVDNLGVRRKEENFADSLGAPRKQEKAADQFGPRRKQENILDNLELLTKDGNIFDNLEPRKKDENLFNKFQIHRKDGTNNKKTITIKKQVNKKGNAILMNPDLENFQDLQIRSSMKEENVVNVNMKQEEVEKSRKLIERRRPEWQTDSLSQQVLNEVRAHIQEKQRLFIHPVPLRKKVKLERVAKLLNLDNIRRKRSAEETSPVDEPLEPELYEVYIESTTCNADYSIPGYFRYGNLSQPFPECCPQRIPTR